MEAAKTKKPWAFESQLGQLSVILHRCSKHRAILHPWWDNSFSRAAACFSPPPSPPTIPPTSPKGSWRTWSRQPDKSQKQLREIQANSVKIFSFLEFWFFESRRSNHEQSRPLAPQCQRACTVVACKRTRAMSSELPLSESQKF